MACARALHSVFRAPHGISCCARAGFADAKGSQQNMPSGGLKKNVCTPAARRSSELRRAARDVVGLRSPQARTPMSTFRPKFITFDCYGTLTRFRMAESAREIFRDRVQPDRMEQFVRDFAAYRLDEVLGAWKPYRDVIRNSVRRTCRKWNVEYRDAEAVGIYEAVPTWGPHADVAEPLKRIAKEIPLVILSNASDDQIMKNVALLEAPFYAVYTAQQAQAYKPRLQAFEYMLDNLCVNPEEILHVSSSLRYDLMSANDIGITHKAFVSRGHEPSTPYYNYTEIKDISGLPALVGL
jgi:2-haloacid dehalogenase